MLPLEDGEDHDSPRSGTSSSDGSAILGTKGWRETKRGANQYDQHPALWKRTIPKGRRCEPLDFSGLILYDEHGNRLHHFTPNPYPRDRPDQVDVA